MLSTIPKILFVGLLFHLFFLGILHYLGMPTFVLSLLRFWKELLLVGLLCGVLLIPKYSRHVPPINIFDVAVLALLVTGIVYFLFFSPYAELQISKFNELRVYFYICAIYWVGRSISLTQKEVLSIFRTYSIAVLISGILGFLNHLLFGYGLISLADNYYAAFSLSSDFGQAVTTEDLLNALYTPYSQIRDLNGSYLSLGNTLLLANVFFLASYFFQKRKNDLYLFLLGTLIILLSGARAATAVFALISLFIITVHFRKPGLSVGLVISFFALFLSLPGLFQKFSNAINEILDLESTAGHVGGWNSFIDAFVSRPFGYGFGVSERSAANFGTAQLIGGESNFSHIVGNLGIIGGAVWITIVIFSWVRASRLLSKGTLPEGSILAFTGLFVSLGYFFIALTQYLNDNLEASLPLWFLIGWIGAQRYQSKMFVENLAPAQMDGPGETTVVV